jgi:hypothetical protein
MAATPWSQVIPRTAGGGGDRVRRRLPRGPPDPGLKLANRTRAAASSAPSSPAGTGGTTSGSGSISSFGSAASCETGPDAGAFDRLRSGLLDAGGDGRPGLDGGAIGKPVDLAETVGEHVDVHGVLEPPNGLLDRGGVAVRGPRDDVRADCHDQLSHMMSLAGRA